MQTITKIGYCLILLQLLQQFTNKIKFASTLQYTGITLSIQTAHEAGCVS